MTNTSVREILHQTALKAPSSSGVYMWRDAEQHVIYVGKAKNLKSRLSSYFSGQKEIKTRMLIAHARSIEYITTRNEYEAFLLEKNLIKKYTPRYNINLKDGKSYPSLKITHEDFPRIYKTRRIVQDGGQYFGPFPDAEALDTFIATLYKLYPLRHCRTFKKRDTPCMYYHIKQCKAPCCGKIAESTYTEYIEEIAALLEGKGTETEAKLTAAMKQAAKELQFEKAARLRDGLKALSVLQNQNVVEGFDSTDRDYIASWREGELVSFTVIKCRYGKVDGRDNFRLVSLAEDEELTEEFICAYYTAPETVPPAIYISQDINKEFLERWLGEEIKAKTEIVLIESRLISSYNPALGFREGNNAEKSMAGTEQRKTGAQENNITSAQTAIHSDYPAAAAQTAIHSDYPADAAGKGRALKQPRPAYGSSSSSQESLQGNLFYTPRDVALVNMAAMNAKEDIVRRLRERGDIPALEELQKLLSLPSLPRRIEGFDIAHIGGKFPVASLISFWNGNPDKKNYREFRLKTTDGIIDDFQSMREATTRRYSRLINEKQPLPDLILIDGGIGQVNAV